MKKIFSIFATVVAMTAFFSCTKVDELENRTNPLPMPEQVAVPVQGLTVMPKTNYVVVGEAVSLSAVLNPEDAQAGTVAWTSSDESVATVDAGGNVTTLSVGVARITATVDGVSATSLVNVFAERVPATEIKLNKTEVTLLVGRAANIKASLLPDGSGEDGIATTDQLNLEWSSSDENVAVVSYGYIQAKSMGEAIVTARQGELSATVKVTVADKIQLVDRGDAWTVTDTPKWDKDWNGNISGSHVEVAVGAFDGEYAYFDVVPKEKFEGIEAVSNSVYEQVTERQDAGEDPSSLFSKGESFSKNYSDMGPAVAYVLSYDEAFEFTGDYAVYEFEGRTPDPVHATGIQFQGQSGWDYAPVTSLEIKEGKSTRVKLALLPEDCTDTGSISLEAEDESMLKVEAYYPQWYPNQYTVSALAAGTTKLIARFNDVVSELEVTITGSSMVWTDLSSQWAGEWGMGLYYGYYECFGFTLNSCTSSSHLIVVMSAADVNGDPATYFKTVASQSEENLSWYASSDIPDFSAMSWNDKDETIERYAFVFGVSSGDYDGNYAIFHYDPNGGSNPDPDPEPVDGKRIKFGDVVFRAELPASRATSDEGSLEAWVYVTSTGGCQNIVGSESNFLLRIDGGELDYVYGGEVDSRGEVGESHVRASITTNEWHHVVATYTQNDKAILYVDGEEAGSAATLDHPVYMDGKTKNDGTYPCWGYPFRFYFGSGSDKHNFSGSVAYVRVYDRAIAAGEISGLMYEEDVEDSALIGYWKFNEGSGNQITDYSGNGITLTAKKALTGGASGNAPTLDDGTITWEDGNLPY